MIHSKPHFLLSDLYKWFDNKIYNVSFEKNFEKVEWANSGAECLAEICSSIANKKKRKINICLPAYFCGQSLRFLRSIPVNFHFYELDENLLPDYSKITHFNNSLTLDVFIHVHYFGNISGQKESRVFADKMNAYLIEDCAHVISPFIKSKWYGDFLIFSPHKHYPLPSIGLIISRDKYFEIKRFEKDNFPFIWVTKEILKRFKFWRKSALWSVLWSRQIQQLKPREVHWRKKSVTSFYLLNYALFSTIRIKNSRDLVNNLSESQGWQPLQNIDQIESPYIVGMKCDTIEIAKKRFEILNKTDQLVMQWPDLPIEIRKDESQKTQAETMSSKILFFFIHQSINNHEFLSKVQSIKNKPNF